MSWNQSKMKFQKFSHTTTSLSLSDQHYYHFYFLGKVTWNWLTYYNVNWFDEIFSNQSNRPGPNAQCGMKWKIYSHLKNISSNQLFSNFFSKTITFTKFLSKMRVRVNFRNYPTVKCALWSVEKYNETRTVG